ncbi:iron-siderophore ABC transporter substrate-binding protein [Agromyces archimandritae]|uniref:Iron-siderophore ABC transporter substrate-binding protein n=1 Tax=Agromyces archimandritae TaxID=2781962 RepID=A0A975FN53_9MICO|nr:iron-siderophore ABC transporter substrate-binding protein [Agromyces archimandritae]QTX05184.1 iron-siderophore ABC transporter substrate-binding protein [Agromyces archimandritae]
MRHRRAIAALATAASAALVLSACATGSTETEPSDGPAAGGASDEFPITIEHAFGETEITEEPVRVATWGWGSTEAAIAAGVYPVAVAEQVWTVGEGNLLPWVEDAYEEAGEELPVVLTDAEGGATVPYEEFVEADVDVIIAPYSGLTEEQYELLSEIAPTVAYPGEPWGTTWDDTIRITADALGRSAAGDEILEGIESTLAGMAEAHPEFAGKTIAGVWDGDGVMSVYTELDPRVGILTELGLEIAPAVSELDTSKGGFYYDLSYEKIDAIDADVVISYHADEAAAKEFLEKPALQVIPAVKAGRVAQVYDPVTVSSVSPPTALTFDWDGGLPILVDKIAEALAK